MIYTNIPYAFGECGKNLGCAYNKFMELLPNDDDWACFIDHDAMFTTPSWYHQLNDIIEKNPDVGAFGCRTNRVANTYQMVGNIDVHNHDIGYHRDIGKHLQTEYYDDLLYIDNLTKQNGFSGVFILLKKSSWKTMGGFRLKGFYSVDGHLRKSLHKHNIPFCIMNGVYVYHWYRADNPYRHSGKTLRRIDRNYNRKNKKKFDLNKIFLYDK